MDFRVFLAQDEQLDPREPKELGSAASPQETFLVAEGGANSNDVKRPARYADSELHGDLGLLVST